MDGLLEAVRHLQSDVKFSCLRQLQILLKG